MQSANDSHPVEVFTEGPVKPTCRSTTPKPNHVPVTPKKQISYKKNLSLNSFEKAYNFFTSLPVSTALLALIISQGASINNSMWYINYTALAAILLTCVAVGLSYLSVPASHRFCESVFLTLYTPASQVFNITISLHDTHEDDSTRRSKLAKKETCPWIKIALLAASICAYTHGLCLVSVCRVAVVATMYHTLSTLLSSSYCGNDSTTSSRKMFDISSSDYTKALFILSLALVDFYLSGRVGLCTLVYFLIIDSTVRRGITDFAENQNIEVMEGLDKYFIDGIFHLIEITITIAAIAANFHLCLLYFVAFYFNIYIPMVSFKQNSAKIRSESLCLRNFPKANASDLLSYDDVCAVCLSGMKYARVLPCKHIFHGKCLKDCLSKKAQCPMCNTQVL